MSRKCVWRADFPVAGRNAGFGCKSDLNLLKMLQNSLPAPLLCNCVLCGLHASALQVHCPIFLVAPLPPSPSPSFCLITSRADAALLCHSPSLPPTAAKGLFPALGGRSENGKLSSFHCYRLRSSMINMWIEERGLGQLPKICDSQFNFLEKKLFRLYCKETAANKMHA